MICEFSELIKVNPRKAWPHEASDFTKWLSQPKNLGMLSMLIGINIDFIKIQANVGKFYADILAQEFGTNRKIIIKNQLEISDHAHLGKIVTYAAGYDADIVIWIVNGVREEHIKTIEWLNIITDADKKFFLITLGLWQIENSKYAPKFEIIVSPNNRTESILRNRKAMLSSDNSLISSNKAKQFTFWVGFKGYVHSIDPYLDLIKAHARGYFNINIGIAGAYISLTILSDSTLGCKLYIPNNKVLYNHLLHSRLAIELEIGTNLIWRESPETVTSIGHTKMVTNIHDPAEARVHYKWLYEQALLFKHVFSKFVT